MSKKNEVENFSIPQVDVGHFRLAKKKMEIGIVGGGLTGLALAEQLVSMGHKVTVFERANQLGGLATYQRFGNFYWDRFYHVILPSDRYLITYIKEIGLENNLHWQNTRTGYFVNKKMYSLSNNIEFLFFPLLSWWSKFRLVLGILYCTRIKNWKKLESIPVEAWLRKYTGEEALQKFWMPLLLAKLGENYKRVSAVFIWTYIRRLFSARDPSIGKEQLGHVQGGYKTVFNRLEDLICSAGGSLLTDTSVEKIFQNNQAISIKYENSIKEHHEQKFDKVIFTAPTQLMQKVVSQELVETYKTGQLVEYLGVICMVTISKTPIVDFYVTNIADEEIPFTGVIGMSTVVDVSETNGQYLTYFPKYIHSSDQLFNSSDQVIKDQFLKGLGMMFPTYPIDDVDEIYINRARYVQPLQVLNFSDYVPKVGTSHPDFLVLNTSQFTSNTLNNNEVIRNVKTFIQSNFSN